MLNLTDAVHKVFSYLHIPEIGVAHALETWTEITKDSPKLKELSSAVISSDVIYTKHTEKKLKRRMEKSGMRSFLYEGDTFKISVSFINSNGEWRLYHAVPSGNYNNLEVFKIGWRKIIDFCKANRITEFYSKEPLTYTNDSMNKVFAHTIRSIEADKVEVYPTHLIKRFKLTKDGKTNDGAGWEIRDVPFVPIIE